VNLEDEIINRSMKVNGKIVLIHEEGWERGDIAAQVLNLAK
jgi:hypothetical protein